MVRKRHCQWPPVKSSTLCCYDDPFIPSLSLSIRRITWSWNPCAFGHALWRFFLDKLHTFAFSSTLSKFQLIKNFSWHLYGKISNRNVLKQNILGESNVTGSPGIFKIGYTLKIVFNCTNGMDTWNDRERDVTRNLNCRHFKNVITLRSQQTLFFPQ